MLHLLHVIWVYVYVTCRHLSTELQLSAFVEMVNNVGKVLLREANLSKNGHPAIEIFHRLFK